MSKLNQKAVSTPVFTHEGMRVNRTSNFNQLKRAVLTTFLWENNAYESGTSVADRIKDLIPKVDPQLVAALAIVAREDYKLRHTPLFLVREMARLENARPFVAETLARVIQRPDELSEFLAMYWTPSKCPLANSVKKGLAKAFTKFDAYSLAKYNQNNVIKLRDVLFLCHAKPINAEQEAIWKQLINNTLPVPSTWETQLSFSNKKETWEKLLVNNELGALALLRNLRNMRESNVNQDLIINALRTMKVERVLPFRFITAARYYPQLESELENSMFKCVEGATRLAGKTALIVDTSPSMWMAKISANSDMDRFEAASALAILLREICEKVNVYAFNRKAYQIPSRRGFALRDAIASTKNEFSCGSLAIDMANKDGYDRIICLTDGQWHNVDGNGNPIPQHFGLKPGTDYSPLKGSKAYMINVANNQNGVGYTKDWNNVDGFSEAIVDYIKFLEAMQD